MTISGGNSTRPDSSLLHFAELLPDAIVGVDECGALALANALATELFGYEQGELLGRPVEELVPPRLREVHREHVARYLADPRVRPMGAHDSDLAGVRKDGTEFPAEISLAAIRTESGLLTIAGIRDLSERRRAEQERRSLEAELERARRLHVEHRNVALEAQLTRLSRLESVGQLAGGIAHDFNNILGVVLNYAQFVGEELGPHSPAWEDVQEIMHAAERGAALTRQLLVFSRRDVGRSQRLDVNQVVADVERLLRRALGEHVELSTRLGPALWHVEADPARIEQILVNLAVNARDAMPEGGRLIVETGNVEIDEHFSELEPGVSPGCYVRLVVSDTGTGMHPDVAQRAFEPLFTTNPANDGNGLGLATIDAIVGAAGGHVHVSSRPGLGTTVKVHLPAFRDAAQPSQPVAPPEARGETVLVVEDEATVRHMSERILRRAGYRVVAAATPRDALEACARGDERIDLLLTDVVMPGMLGPQLVERAAAATPGLKVLYMSGYVHQVLGELDPQHAGELTFVEKPFTADGLLTAVRRALDSEGGRPGSRG